MYCRNCKNEIRDGSRYCKYCGAPQYTESAVSGPVSGNVVKTEGKMRRRIIIMVVAAAVLLGVFFWARAHLFSVEPARQAAPWEKKLTEDFLLPAREGEKYGYKNLDGEWMIEPQFEGANLFFDNGTAIVVKGSRALLIDRQGNVVNAIGINSEVAAAGRLSSYFQDDFVNGKVPITWSENGWNEKKGFMDEEGNVTVFPDNLSLAGDVENTLTMKEKGWYVVYDEYQDAYGYMDGNMNWIIPAVYEDLGAISENGMIPARTDEGWGYINEEGEWLIQPQYREAGEFGRNGLAPVAIEVGVISGEGNVSTRTEWIFINEKGEELKLDEFAPFETVRGFGAGDLAAVNFDNKWGFIDGSGNTVIPRVYDDIAERDITNIYPCDLAGVSKDGNWGCVDAANNIVIPFKYDQCIPVSENMIVGIKDGEYVILNRKNKTLKTGEYGGEYVAADLGLILFYSDTEYQWIDFNGKIY